MADRKKLETRFHVPRSPFVSFATISTPTAGLPLGAVVFKFCIRHINTPLFLCDIECQCKLYDVLRPHILFPAKQKTKLKKKKLTVFHDEEPIR